MQAECAVCGEPTDATVCRRDMERLGKWLRQVVDLVGEVETTVARIARYGEVGGRAGTEPEPLAEQQVDHHRPPVTTFAWAASLERPARGALLVTTLPYLPSTRSRADDAVNTITTWARHVAEERGFLVLTPSPVQGPLCRSGWDCGHQTCDLIRTRSVGHPAARAAVFLLTQLDWVRHRPEAAEVVDALSAAAATLRQCVDAPPALAYTGPCWAELDDGRCDYELYAPEGAATVTCGGCGTGWTVADRRAWLLKQTPDALLNATMMAVALTSVDRPVTSSMIRNYADRGRLAAHGTDWEGNPLYRVDETQAVLAEIELRRQRKAGVAA